MKLTAAAFFLTVALASAQKLELGATAGFGYAGADDLSPRPYGKFGVEACGFCSGRFAIFGEYGHRERVGEKYSTRITRSDLLGGGLRIQFRNRVRPFLDVGIAGGWERYDYLGGVGHHELLGMVIGGGVTIPLGERWYVRPQYRLYALSGYHALTGASVGIGYRF